jgi:hypothetical protein
VKERSLRFWLWFRLTAKGKPAQHWLEMGQKKGYGQDGKYAFDLPLDAHKRAAPENFPEMQRVVTAMQPGDQFGAPFSLFGSVAVWTWLVKKLIPLKARIADIETGRVFDPAALEDQAEGQDHAARMIAGLKIAPAREGRKTAKKKGGPKFKLGIFGSARYLNARLAWGTDDGRSNDEVAAEFGVSAATMWRRMTDNGRKDGVPVARQEAIALHKQGLWMSKKDDTK